MSARNTAGYEALTREFWRVWQEEGVEQLLARYDDFFTEDGVWSPPIAQISGEDYVGRDGFADYVRDFNDAFESFGGEIVAMEDVGADLVRSMVRVSARPSEGGALNANLIAIARMRGGRFAYGWGSYDPEAAEQKLEELRAESKPADA